MEQFDSGADGSQLTGNDAARWEAVYPLSEREGAKSGQAKDRSTSGVANHAGDNLTNAYLSWSLENPIRLHSDGNPLRTARDLQEALLKADTQSLIRMTGQGKVSPEALEILNRNLKEMTTEIQLSYDESGRLIVFNEREHAGVAIAANGDTTMIRRSADGKLVDDRNSKHAPVLALIEISSQLQSSFEGKTNLEDVHRQIDSGKLKEEIKESEKYADFNKKLQELFHGGHEPAELRKLIQDLGKVAANMSPADLKKSIESFNRSQFAKDSGLKFAVADDGSLVISDTDFGCVIQLQRHGEEFLPIVINNGSISVHPADSSMEEWILNLMGSEAERRANDGLHPRSRPF